MTHFHTGRVAALQYVAAMGGGPQAHRGGASGTVGQVEGGQEEIRMPHGLLAILSTPPLSRPKFCP